MCVDPIHLARNRGRSRRKRFQGDWGYQSRQERFANQELLEIIDLLKDLRQLQRDLQSYDGLLRFHLRYHR